MTKETQGMMLGEVSVVGDNGQPITDPRTISAIRVLVVAETCSRYLQQVDGLGFKDEATIAQLTNQLALNLIAAARVDGKRLAADVAAVSKLLNIEIVQVMPGRMDS